MSQHVRLIMSLRHRSASAIAIGSGDRKTDSAFQSAAFRSRRGEFEIERFQQRRQRRREAQHRRARANMIDDDDMPDQVEHDVVDNADRSQDSTQQRTSPAPSPEHARQARLARKQAAAALQRGRLAAYCIADEIRIIALKRHLDNLASRVIPPAHPSTLSSARAASVAIPIIDVSYSTNSSSASEYNPFEGQATQSIRMVQTPTRSRPNLFEPISNLNQHSAAMIGVPTVGNSMVGNSISNTASGINVPLAKAGSVKAGSINNKSGLTLSGIGPSTDAQFSALAAAALKNKRTQFGFVAPNKSEVVQSNGLFESNVAAPAASAALSDAIASNLMSPIRTFPQSSPTSQSSFVSPGIDLYDADEISFEAARPAPSELHRQLTSGISSYEQQSVLNSDLEVGSLVSVDSSFHTASLSELEIPMASPPPLDTALLAVDEEIVQIISAEHSDLTTAEENDDRELRADSVVHALSTHRRIDSAFQAMAERHQRSPKNTPHATPPFSPIPTLSMMPMTPQHEDLSEADSISTSPRFESTASKKRALRLQRQLKRASLASAAISSEHADQLVSVKSMSRKRSKTNLARLARWFASEDEEVDDESEVSDDDLAAVSEALAALATDETDPQTLMQDSSSALPNDALEHSGESLEVEPDADVDGGLPSFLQRSRIEELEDEIIEAAEERHRRRSSDLDFEHGDAEGEPTMLSTIVEGDEHSHVDIDESSSHYVAMPDDASDPLMSALPDLESEHASALLSAFVTPKQSAMEEWVLELRDDIASSGIGNLSSMQLRVALVGSAIRMWCFEDEDLSASNVTDSVESAVLTGDRIRGIREAYFFPFGSVVFFNFSQSNELKILHWLSVEGYLKQGWPAPINAWESDSAELGSINDEDATVQLVTSDVWERLTIAHVWSRSVKVQVFEERVYACITETKHLPRTMAAGRKWTISGMDLNRIIGYLMLEKCQLNLDMDVGTNDTPDFIFFEAPALEQLYWQHADLLEIRKRANVLNQRLDILHNLTNLIKSEMEFGSLKRLELVVCGLVLFQLIVFLLWQMLLKDILHLVSGDVSL